MSNDSPAFDVLSAEENDLWNWAVKRAGVENAATYIRDAAEAAVRAREIRCGGSDAGLAYGKLRKEYGALKQSRDTDLARARVEALTRCAVALEKDAYQHAARFVYAWMDREYPAPKPAECRLSDGSVVRYQPKRDGFERSFPDKYASTCTREHWPGLLNHPTDTGADFDALKAFAATRTEGQ